MNPKTSLFLIVFICGFSAAATSQTTMTSSPFPAQNTPLACELSEPELVKRLQNLHETVFSQVSGWEETETGYRLYLPDEGHNLGHIAEMISLEKTCCPFFQFDLRVNPKSSGLELGISGSEGTKAFLQDMVISKLQQAEEKTSK